MPFEKDPAQGGTDTVETETQSDFDMEAATAEISSELFGQGEAEESKEKPTEGEESSSGTTETADAAASPQPTKEGEDAQKNEGEQKPAAEEENSEAVQATGAPKTWTKAALEKWATIDPVAQAEILKREEDFMRGISGYKQAADLGVRYSKVAEPYAAQLAAHNIDPVQLFQSFAANHYLLSFGQPQQKLEIAATLMRNYGIDLNQLTSYLGDQVIAPVDPEIAALKQEIASLREGQNTFQRQNLDAAAVSIRQQIDEFASDGKHPYFDEVGEHIGKLIESGSVQSLQDAYDTAVYANPVTRQKEVDRLLKEKTDAVAAEEKARLDKIAASTADHVKVNQSNRNGTEPVGTMDETLNETLRTIKSRG